MVNSQITTSGRFGLAVLADIIRDAGGRMHLTSTGTGTTLTVQVPT
jgi:sensor histidine kinase regulating citrate/malate metabolism